LWHKRLAEIIDLAKNLDDPIQHHRLRHSAMAAYLKKPFSHNLLIARKPLIRVDLIPKKRLAHVGFWGDELSGLWAAERVAILRVMKADVIG